MIHHHPQSHATQAKRTGGALLPELELRESLVGEGGGHDEGGVARGAAEVEEAALGEHDDAVAVGEDEAVHLFFFF